MTLDQWEKLGWALFWILVIQVFTLGSALVSAVVLFNQEGRFKMHDAFQVHMLNEDGKRKAQQIAEAFDACLKEVSTVVPEGRELALVKTKLEEACFFAKKGMAKANTLG